MENRAKSAMGGKKSSKATKKKGHGKKPRRMTIDRAANGGFVANHEYDQEPGQEPVPGDMHALADHPALMAHVNDQMMPPPEDEGGGEPQPMA